MKYRTSSHTLLEYGCRTDADGNPHQEDAIYPSAGARVDDTPLFVLCDGMGGHDAGEVASATVCEALSRTAAEGDTFDDEQLRSAIDSAFDSLDAADSGESIRRMGTTMTLLRFHDRGATVAHMGDSRVYHIRPGRTADKTQILFVTSDHSLVNTLVQLGEMTPEEARVSPRRNIITRAMQPHMNPRPSADVTHIDDIRPGDVFVLCSDGMLEQAPMDDGTDLRRIFASEFSDADDEPDICRWKELAKITKDNADNHSMIMVRVISVENKSREKAGALSRLKDAVSRLSGRLSRSRK